jgi:hypothetical protein
MTIQDAVVTDQAGADWTLQDQRDAATMLVLFRGDW